MSEQTIRYEADEARAILGRLRKAGRRDVMTGPCTTRWVNLRVDTLTGEVFPPWEVRKLCRTVRIAETLHRFVVGTRVKVTFCRTGEERAQLTTRGLVVEAAVVTCEPHPIGALTLRPDGTKRACRVFFDPCKPWASRGDYPKSVLVGFTDIVRALP